MISWIPLLGKNGLVNSSLMGVGLIHQPLEFLLFSDFAVVVAYVHQLTIFMIVPIFNAMARIDKRTIEAALDAGASRYEIMRYIVVPLSKNGIALGSIFVLSIVMGDFFVVKVMSGGGSASIVSALFEDIAVLQYPSAAAAASRDASLRRHLFSATLVISRSTICGAYKARPRIHASACSPSASANIVAASTLASTTIAGRWA
jgi:ABC-type spermidine/putrescine transport system permease subunit I